MPTTSAFAAKSSAGVSTERETNALRVPFEVKQDSMDDEARTFTGLASTWDLDLGGDVIHQGAFKQTLRHWRESGKVLPLLDSHSAWNSVRAVVGKMVEATETDDGLEATFEVIDGPDGDEIWRRLKGGFVDGLSIGYRAVKVEEPSDEERLTGVWRHLKEVELREVSVVVWPMNPAARVDGDTVKALIDQVDTLRARSEQRPLTDDEKAELTELRQKVGDLLAPEDEEPASDTKPGDATDHDEGEKELAPDDPARLEAGRKLAEVRLRALGTRANRYSAA